MVTRPWGQPSEAHGTKAAQGVPATADGAGWAAALRVTRLRRPYEHDERYE
ncbi:hypothetical protein ABZ865_19155 [Streptomyces sp. NPDC047085]|uniref:hypothetical protein n=1 Tax=Streptomyces sp. NPDC047085 TaxID=3155140 RepID=UPI0033CD47D3